MCKPAWKMVEREPASEGPYEGETVRLDPGQGEMALRRASHRRDYFPWWTLWMIWPLVFLVKGAFIAVASAASALAGGLGGSAAPGAYWLPILLIVVGIVLWRRR